MTEIVKTPEEIQYAHDLFHALVTGVIPNSSPETEEEAMLWGAAMSVFCWLVGHPFGENVDVNLAKIEQVIVEAGMNFGDLPDEDILKSNGHGPPL